MDEVTLNKTYIKKINQKSKCVQKNKHTSE